MYKSSLRDEELTWRAESARRRAGTCDERCEVAAQRCEQRLSGSQRNRKKLANAKLRECSVKVEFRAQCARGP